MTNNLIPLPAETSPLRVAVVYNQKKEDASQAPDESAEPPSLFRRETPASDSSSSFQPSTPGVSDLYAEWDSPETIRAVRDALLELHEVTLIEADHDAFERLRDSRPDIVFNIAEGLHGVSRESQIPAMLEYLRIPYTGSDPLTLALCLDKSRAKQILSFLNVATPRFEVVDGLQAASTPELRFPCIVKPLHEGSSKGIFDSSLVQNQAELQKGVRKILDVYGEPALVEEYLDGREFTVAMLGNGEDVMVLPIVEILFDSLPGGVNHIYSFEAKWIWDQSTSPLEIFRCPADLSPSLKVEIERVCRLAYAGMNCRDWCRIDVRLDGAGMPNILELNPLPGILPKPEDNSCFPKAARAAGISYNRLIQTVVEIASKRYGLRKGHFSFQPQLAAGFA